VGFEGKKGERTTAHRRAKEEGVFVKKKVKGGEMAGPRTKRVMIGSQGDQKVNSKRRLVPKGEHSSDQGDARRFLRPNRRFSKGGCGIRATGNCTLDGIPWGMEKKFTKIDEALLRTKRLLGAGKKKLGDQRTRNYNSEKVGSGEIKPVIGGKKKEV